ncbi:MAG: phosphonate C-P lyase system protein PhnG [Burkholderiales bacterium]|nr:phosphonate C-P lyase system protein PhnG [Burkholderiales bacterium]
MWHAVDEALREARRDWMGLLARAPLAFLEQWARTEQLAGALPARTWLRPPETGLVMLRARAGGSGERFNLGEMTITRCALRLDSGEVGIAYVQGRSARKAELAALADALLQRAERREALRARLVEPLRARLAAEAERAARKAQATRVEFFTLARAPGEPT